MKQVLLGAAAAVVAVLGIGAVWNRPAAPPSRVVPDNGGALASVAIHFDPRVADDVGDTYQDLFREMPATVEVYIVVEKQADFDQLHGLLRRWNIAAPERFHAVVVGKPITTWSRDRYTLLVEGRRPVLLVPPRPTEGNPARHNDWEAPFALAAAIPGLRTRTAEAMFEGGDITATEGHVFATALLRERNRGGDLDDPEQLRAWLRYTTGKQPVLLGDTLADVPGHHICMFLSPLDDHRVMVGDPDLGIALFDRSGSDPAALPLPIDRREDTLRRFRNVIAQLAAEGFEVIRVPLVPLSDGLTYVTYNNALLEHRDGVLHAYLPQFDIPALDQAGRRLWEAQGAVVHPIRVARVYRFNGAVRCLVNILARYSSANT